jgi:hypothetical protein
VRSQYIRRDEAVEGVNVDSTATGSAWHFGEQSLIPSSEGIHRDIRKGKKRNPIANATQRLAHVHKTMDCGAGFPATGAGEHRHGLEASFDHRNLLFRQLDHNLGIATWQACATASFM